MLLSSLGTSIANVGLPTFAQAFSASFQDVQWVVLAYLLASTTLIVGVGRLGDITGRRRLLLAGIVLFTVASVLCGVAPALWLLIGAQRMTIVGLIVIAAGSFILSMLPAALGIPGYIAPIVVITVGYALFQTANNTAVMTDIRPDQRGVISGLLNLSRNLGLITGASAMGAVFALASATIDITTAAPEAVATGMRITFAVAGVLIVVALAIAVGTYRRTSAVSSSGRPASG
jgi:MFS family permease